MPHEHPDRGATGAVQGRTGRDTLDNDRWAACRPTVTVVVATYNRCGLLGELFEALAAQTLDPATFDVVIADNGSTDDTWAVLGPLVDAAPFPVRVVRVPVNRGPALGRNRALAHARGELVAFTDDDCIPQPAWLAELVRAAGACRIVQGRTLPDPRPPRRWWDHTISVLGVTDLFETCNLAFRRDDVLAVGGFAPLPRAAHGRGDQPFGGEDTLVGWSVVRATGATVGFAPAAVVHHRVEPRTRAQWVARQRRAGIFPALVVEVPELRRRLLWRVFLSRRTASFDLAAVSLLVAVLRRRPLPLVGVVPYLSFLRRRVRLRSPRASATAVATMLRGDCTTARALLVASVRNRTVVL